MSFVLNLNVWNKRKLNCKGHCDNITYDNCYSYQCFNVSKESARQKQIAEDPEEDKLKKYRDAKDNLVVYLDLMQGQTLSNDMAKIVKKVNMGRPNKRARKLLLTKLEKARDVGMEASPSRPNWSADQKNSWPPPKEKFSWSKNFDSGRSRPKSWRRS